MTDRPGTDQHVQTPDSPYVVVTFGDQFDPSTWTQVGVQTAIRNRVAYELEAHRKGWAPISGGAVYTMWRYIAWDALHARGDFPGTFPEFAQAAWDVAVKDAPDDAEGPVGPTRPEATPA